MKKKIKKKKKSFKKLTEKELAHKIANSKRIRQALTQESHYWFFHTFFSHYIQYDTAPFQKEMLDLCEDESHQFLAVMAFRESGKSTIITLSYPLWAILGKPRKKCVIIISKTQDQAKALFLNIKRELEDNALLKSHLGPFRSDNDPWKLLSLELSRFDARIFALSRGQSVRGIRHGTHRPDLIILDDVEDTSDIKTEIVCDHWNEKKESELDRWFTNEVLPAAHDGARIVILGNLLSKECFLMRVKQNIDTGKMDGIFRAYPFLDDEGKVLWPSKFTTMKSINNLKKRFQGEEIWDREYLLLYDSEEGFDFFKDDKEELLERIDPEMTPKIGMKLDSMNDYLISAPRPAITNHTFSLIRAIIKAYGRTSHPEKGPLGKYKPPVLPEIQGDEPYLRLPHPDDIWEEKMAKQLQKYPWPSKEN